MPATLLYMMWAASAKRPVSPIPLKFWSKCPAVQNGDPPRYRSPRLSAYVSEKFLHVLKTGHKDAAASVQWAMSRAASDGISSLQIEASKALHTQRRTGRLVDHQNAVMEASFGFPFNRVEYLRAEAKLGSNQWGIIDYGDTIPTCDGGPVLDAYDLGAVERNK